MNTAEQRMYGMSEADIREQYMNSITARLSGLEMVVMSILSDAQEMTAFAGTGQTIRQQLNIAKFILCEMQDQRVE